MSTQKGSKLIARAVAAPAIGGALVGLAVVPANAEETPGQAESNDRMGAAVATGDFDGNGFDDLATGAPGEAIGLVLGGGAVTVTYATSAGLSELSGDVWSQGSATSGLAGTAETDDHFGAAVAAGDFNGDGFDDLAIGVPEEDATGVSDTGVVHVIYGSPSGLTVAGEDLWHQNFA